eukprot:scaffold2141_cov282-Pinguiococcus_pyrenoidosus.AAC.17
MAECYSVSVAEPDPKPTGSLPFLRSPSAFGATISSITAEAATNPKLPTVKHAVPKVASQDALKPKASSRWTAQLFCCSRVCSKLYTHGSPQGVATERFLLPAEAASCGPFPFWATDPSARGNPCCCRSAFRTCLRRLSPLTSVMSPTLKGATRTS